MNYEDKLTKKSNLDINDSISVYNGWGAQQNYNVFQTFHNFLNDIKPERILEIGTSIGGFSCFLRFTCEKLKLNTHILTYDIIEFPWYKEMISEGIDVRVENIFYENYTSLKEEVVEFINKDGTTLILCDGGDKISEFNLLSNYLKVGDFIMAHDYAYDHTTFNEKIHKKIWNWFEISEENIKETCHKNNLVSFNQDVFDDVVWVCKTKI